MNMKVSRTIINLDSVPQEKLVKNICTTVVSSLQSRKARVIAVTGVTVLMASGAFAQRTASNKALFDAVLWANAPEAIRKVTPVTAITRAVLLCNDTTTVVTMVFESFSCVIDYI